MLQPFGKRRRVSSPADDGHEAASSETPAVKLSIKLQLPNSDLGAGAAESPMEISPPQTRQTRGAAKRDEAPEIQPRPAAEGPSKDVPAAIPAVAPGAASHASSTLPGARMANELVVFRHASRI